MVKSLLISTYLLCVAACLCAQNDSSAQATFNKKRFAIVTAGNAAFFTGSFIILNKAWYAEYERTGFHFFDDNPEWNQMDKAGHVWSTYQLSRVSSRMWQWTGIGPNQAAIAGAFSGIVFQSVIEMQDAYSAKWGFSWGDMLANVAGAALFTSQEIGWKEQRIAVKMGFHSFDYPPELLPRRNELFGKSTAERILKDYNSQTYWLTANIASLTRRDDIPSWLNVSIGYAAGGMFGGRTNVWTDEEGRVNDFSTIPRSRKFYLSPDIDLTRIPTKRKTWRTLFSIVNAFRIPLPAIELENGKLRGVIR